jgi:hypothetical protein
VTGCKEEDVQQRIALWTRALLVLFAALNIGDLLSTWLDLRAGLHEGNPLMNVLLAQHGFAALILYKVFVIGVVAVVAAAMWRDRPKLVAITLVACNVLVLGAVAINVLQYPGLALISPGLS